MSVAIPNYDYKYLRKRKHVFVPSGVGRRIGLEVKEKVEDNFEFDPFFFHLKRGGHVAAIHSHRNHRWFARIDISNFFYSVSRRRVRSALDRIGLGKAQFYAKWSTVSNPYHDPKYALPYGFVQSPILASLVIATSSVGEYLRNLPDTISPSVYVDDISLSSDSLDDLVHVFDEFSQVLQEDGFSVSQEKLRRPAAAIDIFNCNLEHARTEVRHERVEEFFASYQTEEASGAFTAYCASVEVGNEP